MNILLQEIRFAVRSLTKRPAFAFIVIATLAIGIGANTAIFTVVDAALLRSLPYANASRLVHLWETQSDKELAERGASFPDYQDWSTQNTVFDGVAGYSGAAATMNGNNGVELLTGARVTSGFFGVLGINPRLGRTFAEGEDRAGGDRLIVLSNGFWKRRFASDPGIVGRQIVLSDQSYSVIGVLPEDFQFARAGDVDFWLPLTPSPQQVNARFFHFMNVIARLKAGVSTTTANEQMATIATRIASGDARHQGTSIKVVPLQVDFVGSLRPILFALLGAVGLVLLISCVNVANLLLARSTSRRREIAVRIALGARRRHLIRQLLIESLVLSAVGGTVGLFIALWGVDLLISVIPESRLAYMPYLRDLTLNPQVLIFTAGLSVVSGVLFGLAPALEASRWDVQGAMKEGSKSSSSRRAGKLREILVVTEVAIALVLLVGAGLFMKSFARMLRVDPGFNTTNLLTMKIAAPPQRYSEDVKTIAFYDTVLDHLRHLPGIEGAALISNLPLGGDGNTGTPNVVGRPVATEDASNESFLRVVSPNYFSVMGVPLIKGRPLDERDTVNSQQVVVINQTLATSLFPGEEAVGQRITFPFTADLPPYQIAGIVADEKIRSLDSDTLPVIYFPYRQGPESSMSLLLRTNGEPQNVFASARKEILSVDPETPIYAVTSMDNLISNAPATFIRKYPAYLITLFAAVAFLLATIGIYGVIAYSVGERVREIAIRVVLGAQDRDILSLIIRQGMLPAIIGVAVGLAGSLALTRVISSLLFGVSSWDPLTYLVVAVTLLVVAVFACYLPARKALRINPNFALRYE